MIRIAGGRYRTLVETMQEGLGVQDKNGRITFMNRRGREMLGYELAELIGKPTSFVFDEANQRILREQMAKRREGERQSYEITWERKDGGKVHTIVAPSPRFDEHGHLVESAAVFTDITERKRAGLELQRQTELANLLEFLARIANEAESPEEAMRASLARISSRPPLTKGVLLLPPFPKGGWGDLVFPPFPKGGWGDLLY